VDIPDLLAESVYVGWGNAAVVGFAQDLGQFVDYQLIADRGDENGIPRPFLLLGELLQTLFEMGCLRLSGLVSISPR
jgi:hypothetical protein